MDFTIPSPVTYLIAWAATIGGIWLIFEKIEDVLSPGAKATVSKWLEYFDPSVEVENWPETFTAWFDQIFGQRRTSLRFLIGSFIASLIAVILVTTIWVTLHGRILAIDWADVRSLALILAFLWIAAPFVLNFIPDYLSLLETRYFLGKAGGKHALIRGFALLGIDTATSGAIGLVTIALFFGYADDWDLKMVWSDLGNALVLSEDGKGYFGIYFYSTFLTTVWAWLYVAALLVLRLIQVFFILDIQDKPLRSVGLVAIVSVTIAFVIAVFARG